MKKPTVEIKAAIISATIDLIENSNGNINKITTRAIADKANVGIGLINYHFQTKDNLIEICVQQIIGKVVSSFKPKGAENLTGIKSLTYTVIQVIDFLFENSAVSRISILGDFHSPNLTDNTMKTIQGFDYMFYDCKMTENERNIFLFAITSTIQAAFLRRNNSKAFLGYDLNVKSERDTFITTLISLLNGGLENE